MRQLIANPLFSLGHFFLVIVCGALLYLFPDRGLWILLLAAVPTGLRLTIDRSVLQPRVNALSLLIFGLTAIVGFWVAYDATAAWNKLCLIFAAVLFFLVIAGQAAGNVRILAGFWFIVGIGIAAYFLLTHDFRAAPVKFQIIHELGLAWMKMRPASLRLPTIHPNAVSDIATVTSAYGLFFLGESASKPGARIVGRIATLAGLAIVSLALLLSASRGGFLALAGAVGFWLVWRCLLVFTGRAKEMLTGLFPYFVIVSLFLISASLFIIPLGFSGLSFLTGGDISISRAELVQSGLWIVQDFPFTGGGLTSFPGLYSQYVLVIPYYSMLHSHNLFLDVMIEQGLLGGFSFVLLYVAALWQLLSAMRNNRSKGMQLLYFAACISLFGAILHGMVDDNIYGGRGTILAFVPAAMAVLVSKLERDSSQALVLKTSDASRNPSRPQMVVPSIWRWGIAVFAILIVLTSSWQTVAAQWYANMGAVKMAKLDLATFPANQWYDGSQSAPWSTAASDFQRALVFDPDNRTANHRLGLLHLLERDFAAASNNLHKAYEQDPTHRGVIKNLGYSYSWLGETEKAKYYLAQVPEAKYELEVYVWWWGTQSRFDLADKASLILAQMEVGSSPQ